MTLFLLRPPLLMLATLFACLPVYAQTQTLNGAAAPSAEPTVTAPPAPVKNGNGAAQPTPLEATPKPAAAPVENGKAIPPSPPAAIPKAAAPTPVENGKTPLPPPPVPPAATPALNGKAAPTAPPAAIPKAAPPVENGKAAAPPSPTLSDLGRSLRNYFTEEELSLLFQYMKESVIASFKDEEVNLPPDLSFKLEILLVRMKKEGGHYMDNLINQLEKDLKNSLKEKLKEKLTPPPIKEQPYNPWLTTPWQ